MAAAPAAEASGGAAAQAALEPSAIAHAAADAADVLAPRRPDRAAAPTAASAGDPDGASAAALAAAVAPERAGECSEAGAPLGGADDPAAAAADPAVGVLVSPARPSLAGTVAVLAATLGDEAPLAVRVIGPDGAAVAGEVIARPGVPSQTLVRWRPDAAGRYRVVVGRDGRARACATFTVQRAPAPARVSDPATLWPVTRAWSAAEEALYSAWVRELFHAPLSAELAFRRLDELTRDPARNLLHEHWGAGEDGRDGLQLEPDCADLPYVTRAYFAWKRGLPFVFHRCSRGRGRAPECRGAEDLLTSAAATPADAQGLASVVHYFRRTLTWGVHSGNGRTAHDDGRSDFYPVRLDRRGLRPGTIYADPYGHVLMVVELVDPAGDRPGVLFAADGQPDASITRKRFWAGHFLWNPDPSLGGSGFKAPRPVVRERDDDGRVRMRVASDAEIDADPGYGDRSLEQRRMEAASFYGAMARLITPGIRDARRELEATIDALAEQARQRVTSVAIGEEFMQARGGALVAMPDGHAIFETSGPWEDYATPSRDLRLLIAIDVALAVPAAVARDRAAFGLEHVDADVVARELTVRRDALLADPSRALTYRGTDGREHTLTLAELVARASALEVGWDPNDCVELRWGAPEGSDELAACKRRAPPLHRRKQAAYRAWFHERRRPARGDPGPVIPPAVAAP